MYYHSKSDGTSYWEKPIRSGDRTAEGVAADVLEQTAGKAGSASRLMLSELDRQKPKHAIALSAEKAAVKKSAANVSLGFEPAPARVPAAVVAPTSSPAAVVAPTSSPAAAVAPTSSPAAVVAPTSSPAAVVAPTSSPAAVALPSAPHGVNIAVQKIPTASDPDVDRYSLVITALPSVFDHIIVQHSGSGNVGNFWQSVAGSLATT